MAFESEQLIAFLIPIASLLVASFPKQLWTRVAAFGSWLIALLGLLFLTPASSLDASIIALVLFVLVVHWALRGKTEMTPTLWLGAASCVISAAATSLFLLWISLAFLILHTLTMRIAYGRQSLSEDDALPISALSLSAGLAILWLTSPGHSAQQLASILIVCGIGGLLEWFPFPRVSRYATDVVEIIPCQLLPVISAATFFWKLVALSKLNESNLAWLAIAALFSLLFSALKVMGETSLTRRISLIPMTILSHSLIATLLFGWVQLTPLRNWTATSNFPSAVTLFLTILVCESIACMALIAGCRMIVPDADHDLSDDLFSGMIKQRPWAGTILLTSIISLAGLAPFAGFWWRFLITSTLLLPHRQSSLNGLTEAHVGFTTMAIVLVLIWLLLSVSYMSLVGKVLFEIPFRIRDISASFKIRAAAIILLMCLLALSVMPFRFAEQMTLSIR